LHFKYFERRVAVPSFDRHRYARPMKQAQTSILIGAMLLGASTLGDSVFHLPYGITMPPLAASLLLMWHGSRLQRSVKASGEARPSPMSPTRRFALLVGVLVFATISGFFILRYSHPNQSVATHLIISAVAFAFGVGVSYWQVLRRAKPGPTPDSQ